MLSNMASSLIQHKRITTTVAKAKALRKYVEPLITKAKTDNTHSRRMVFSYLQDKDSVSTLFNEVAEKVASRPGGYTRIIKTGNRLGDNADMCIIELVDYNELLLGGDEKAGAKKSRRRRGGAKKNTEAAPVAEAKAEAAVEEAPVAEEVAEETAEAVVEETAAEVEETPAAETEEAPEAKADKADEASSEEEKKD